jgi:hypothetical protein
LYSEIIVILLGRLSRPSLFQKDGGE